MNTPDPIQMLRENRVRLSPLAIEVIHLERRSAAGEPLIDVSWSGKTQRFVVEAKRDAKPRTLQTAIDVAQRLAATMKSTRPMILVPYLPDEKIDALCEQEVSALDCCGNGVVIVPGEWFVCIKGNPNQYRERTPIASAYRGDSSLVARSLLLKQQFDAVSDIETFITERNGSLALSTVSKMLKRLADDLVIERPDRSTVRLIQPERLLDQLLAEYEAPSIQETWVGKVPLSTDELARRFAVMDDAGGLVRTGASSTGNYAAYAGEPVAEYYCRRAPTDLLDELAVAANETEAFPNLRLLRTDDQRVYFDRRDELIASPIQAWLEAASGDKRQKDAAIQLRRMLLQYLESTRG